MTLKNVLCTLTVLIVLVSILIGIENLQQLTYLQNELIVSQKHTDVARRGNHRFLLSQVDELQDYLEQEIQAEAATRVSHNWNLQTDISKIKRLISKLEIPRPIPSGLQGVAGEKGEKGDTGAIGIQGEKGDTWYNDLPKLYKQTSPAVVWIGAECNGNDFLKAGWKDMRSENIPITVKWQGTGFFVTPNLIATAGHVVDNTKSFIVQFQDGLRTYADFVHMEKTGRCDVGFIKLRGNRCNDSYLDLDTEVEIGESLIILGYPWGLNTEISITSGIVAAQKHKWYPYLKLSLFADIASYPGNSGSPVLNMDGEVIGVLVGGPHENESYSMCTPARLVELAMQKALAEIGLMEAE